MRAKVMQLLASRYSARILLVLVVLGLALAMEPASAENVCNPDRFECP